MTTTAQTLLSAFYTKEIDDDTKVVINPDHEHADTVRAMVFAADQSGLGWDFAYEAVRAAVQYLADTDTDPTDNDDAHEFATGAVDIYTASLILWLADSPLKHAQLCDEASADLGNGREDLGSTIRNGQYHAYTLAYAAVVANWPDDEDDDA